MNLLGVSKAVAAIRDLGDGRMAAARTLIPDLDAALTGVEPGTARRLWIQLARNATGRPVGVRSATPEQARAACMAALSSDDPVTVIRTALAADQTAQEVAARTRRALAQAVGDGRRAGVTVETLMQAAGGISRQTVYDWTAATHYL
jgi:hypothetical protein